MCIDGVHDMSEQIPLSNNDRADRERDGLHIVTDDVAYKRLMLVNVILIGKAGAGPGGWVLIDAGVTGSLGAIRKAAAERFGENATPACIIQTHGHFDHVGALEELAEEWNVPVYAHPLEIPYLDGSNSYPPPDPKVGGGMMSTLSPLYSRGPVNVKEHLRTLPEDGSVPDLPGWKWIHTPGHAPGHISLWREADRLLISGDAVITTDQESAYAVATQKPELHGPPMYFTIDWELSERSVKELAALDPQIIVSSHGQAMQGLEMLAALHRLANEFRDLAVPSTGRYVEDPQWVKKGEAYRKP